MTTFTQADQFVAAHKAEDAEACAALYRVVVKATDEAGAVWFKFEDGSQAGALNDGGTLMRTLMRNHKHKPKILKFAEELQ